METVVEVASPRELVAHRARMAVAEARRGRLRTVEWEKPQRGFVVGQSDFMRPIYWEYQRRTWGHAMRWVHTPSGPVAELRVEEFTIRSRPPVLLRVEDGQLHSTAGPAIAWADGTAHCLLRGVMIPPRLWAHLMRGTLEIDTVLRERNQAVQAVLMEQIGWAGAMRSDKYTCSRLDHDERWGTLWQIEWVDRSWSWETRAQATVLEVVNRSPEPDGHFRHYWLQVDSDCRPIMADGRFGDRQKPTSLNAVASTFGMEGAAYEALLGEES